MTLRIVVPEGQVIRWLRLTLLMIGFGCLDFFAYSYLYRATYQAYEGWQFDHRQSTPAARRSMLATLPDPDRGNGPKASSHASVVGRLSIPRLHLSAMVEEGVDENTLSRAVGHIPGTSLPGEKGNIGIAGHRDTFFRALRDLKPHDKIEFATNAGRFRYTVSSLTIVEPNDVSVLKSSRAQTLTIVTCFPFNFVGNAPRRFIVHAVAN
jgi:sortase A